MAFYLPIPGVRTRYVCQNARLFEQSKHVSCDLTMQHIEEWSTHMNNMLLSHKFASYNLLPHGDEETMHLQQCAILALLMFI